MIRLALLLLMVPYVVLSQNGFSISSDFGFLSSKFKGDRIFGVSGTVIPSYHIGSKIVAVSYTYGDTRGTHNVYQDLKYNRVSLLYGLKSVSEDSQYSLVGITGPTVVWANASGYNKYSFGWAIDVSLSYRLWNSLFAAKFGVSTSMEKQFGILAIPYAGLNIDFSKK